MKPWLLGLAGFGLVAVGIGTDLALLTESWIRNGYWSYAVLAPGAVLALWAIAKKRSIATIALGAFAVLAIGAYSFVRFLPTPTSPPAVGVNQDFPNFTLKDQDGKEVSLGELRRDGPVVVVLFRGRW